MHPTNFSVIRYRKNRLWAQIYRWSDPVDRLSITVNASADNAGGRALEETEF